MSEDSLKKTVTLCTVARIPIRIHVSYIAFVMGMIALLTFTHGGTWALKTSQIIAYLFISVVVHELGHAYAAYALGHKVHNITVYPVGGLASIEIVNSKHADLAWIAFAGPAANFVLFLLCMLFENLALDSLGILSLILGLGNLLPIRSFDGGVILRSMIIEKIGDKKTNQILLGTSIIIVILVGITGIYMKSLLVCISALFMFIYGVMLNDNSRQSDL